MEEQRRAFWILELYMEIISQIHLPVALPLGGPRSRSGEEEYLPQHVTWSL